MLPAACSWRAAAREGGRRDHYPPGPLYPHHLLNTSDAELKVLSISTQIKPEICEYPDFAKSMAWAPGVKLVQRAGGRWIIGRGMVEGALGEAALSLAHPVHGVRGWTVSH